MCSVFLGDKSFLMVYQIPNRCYNEEALIQKYINVGDAMLNFLFLFTILLYLAVTIFSLSSLGFLISFLCLIIVVLTFIRANKFVRLIASAFLLLGICMLWSNEASWIDYFTSFGPMLDLLALFTLVPVLALPIKLGAYSEEIQGLTQKFVKKSKHLYMMTSSISYFLSIFMNVASIPMTYYCIKPALAVFPLQNKDRFISRAVTHGFTMPLLWSPITPVVGIVISMTGVSWMSILPYVLPLSLLGLILDWFMGSMIARKNVKMKAAVPNETAASLEAPTMKPKRLFHIMIGMVIFNFAILAADHFFPLSFLIIVSLLVIPLSLGWSILLNKGKEYWRELKEYGNGISKKMSDQFCIYLAAGFFISAIKMTKTDILINTWILHYKEAIGIEFFFILLPLIPVLLAFIGLHPAVTLALMAQSLDADVLNISPHFLTVSMLMGAVAAFLIGPFNTTIGLMSNMIKTSPFKVSNWNMNFAATYLLCGIAYLSILRMI